MKRYLCTIVVFFVLSLTGVELAGQTAKTTVNTANPANPATPATPANPATPATAAEVVVANISFDKTPFRDCLVKISQIAKVQIIVDWSSLVNSCGLRPDNPVSFSGRNMTVAACMDQALARVRHSGGPAAWYIGPRGFTISSRRRILGLRSGMLSTVKRLDHRPARSGHKSDNDTDRIQDRRPARSRAMRVNFRDKPASEVFEQFRELLQRSATGAAANLSIRWADLENIGISRDTPVTLVINQPVSPARALDLAIEAMSQSTGRGNDPLDKAWLINDRGVMVVTSGAALDKTLEVRTWYVGDLLFVRPNFRGPVLNSSRSDSGDSGSEVFDDSDSDEDSGDAQQARQRQIDHLTSVVKKAIGQQYWQPAGRGSVRMFKDRMIITQTRLGFLLLEKSTGLR